MYCYGESVAQLALMNMHEELSAQMDVIHEYEFEKIHRGVKFCWFSDLYLSAEGLHAESKQQIVDLQYFQKIMRTRYRLNSDLS